MMFMKKNSGKKVGACVILTVGALAAVGALAITNKGKQMMCMMKKKCRDMVDKCTAMGTNMMGYADGEQ